MNLTNNQKKFCQEYLKLGMNATQAYMKVYKTCKKEETARTNASRMLTNANIKKYIEELRLKVEEKAIVNIDMVVKELAAIAFTDRTKIAKLVKKTIESKDGKKIEYEDIEFAYTDDLEEIDKKVIAGYKRTKNGICVETYDKVKALELLGKYLGMFTETVKIENPEATKILSSISRQLGGKSE